MAGIFDDLIPGTQAPAQASMQNAPLGTFDDLVPSRAPADALLGPRGLFWNKDGGYDSKTGKLIIAGKPFSEPSASPAVAAVTSLVNGVPIAGPTLQAGMENFAAGIRSAATETPFDQTLSSAKDVVDRSQAENPGIAKAANVAGAIASAVPAAGTALGARALGLVGSVPGRVAQGALGGAAIGAADAGVRGESPEGGALAGGAFGAGGPLLGAAAGKVVHAIGDQLAPPLASMADINSPARQMLLKPFQDATPQAIAAGQQRVGPYGFLGDLSPELTDLTGSVSDSTGPGKGIVRDAYNVRDRNAAPAPGNMGPTTGPRTRIEQAITDAFGPQTNIVQTTDADMAARSASADPLYAAWRAAPVPMTPELSAIAQLPSVQRALPAARRMAGDEGQNFLDAAGNPTAQTWDYVKRAMDDTSRNAGYGTNEARIANGISQRITGAIDNHPDPNVAGIWQRARQAWANPTAVMNAQEYGQTLFSRNMAADQVAHDLAPMSGPERAAVVEGARSQIQDLMDASTRGDTQARNILLAPANRQKLAQVVGQPRADSLLQSLQQEAELKVQNENVIGGSQTTPKAARLALTAPPGPDTGFLGWWNRFSPVDKPASIIPQMRGNFQNSQYENARAQIAPLLTTSGDARDALVHQLMHGSQISATNAARANSINDLATMLMASGGSEEGRRAIAPQNLRWLTRQ